MRFDDKIDDAERLLGQVAAADRRDHEATLGKLGAAVDLLDAHVQAAFSAGDVGEGPETRLLQEQLGQARSAYEKMKTTRGEALAGHQRALAELLAHLRESWRHRHEHDRRRPAPQP